MPKGNQNISKKEMEKRKIKGRAKKKRIRSEKE
jgi:hypothetical protein